MCRCMAMAAALSPPHARHACDWLPQQLRSMPLPSVLQLSYEGPHHGLFLGDSPSHLRPLELHGTTGKAAWPVANPLLLSGPAGGDISRPSLFPTVHGALYAFFAQRNCSSGRSVIAAAVSNGGGASWRYLGSVLEEPFDLAAPFVFQDIFSGQVLAGITNS